MVCSGMRAKIRPAASTVPRRTRYRNRVRVAGIVVLVPGAEGLEAGRGLDKCSIHGEVVVRQQVLLVRHPDYCVEQGLAHRMRRPPLAVLGEESRVEAGFNHVQEPAVRQGVRQLLAKETFAVHQAGTIRREGQPILAYMVLKALSRSGLHSCSRVFKVSQEIASRRAASPVPRDGRTRGGSPSCDSDKQLVPKPGST